MITTLLHLLSSTWVIALSASLLLQYYLVPYLANRPLRRIPAPFPAALSNLWLLLQCRRGRRYAAVHDAHARLGKVVRIQPNHVSINDVRAINVIYGHQTGFLKSEYYDAFVSIQRGLFNTRSRAEHTRKRKAVSSIFSPRHIAEFEPYVRSSLELLVQQWRSIAAGSSSRAEIDALHWLNYLAFDIIGDLAFGAPFGMLAAGADRAAIRSSPDAPVAYAPAIQVLNRRGEVSATLGCLPGLKPWARWLPDPFFRNGLAAVQSLAGIAVARVQERLAKGSGGERESDLLARLMEASDGDGKRMGREELTAEALTQLIAGSDTTSNTTCAILFWTLKTPGVMDRLQAELDAALPSTEVPSFSQIRDLPYLRNVINETLRLHSTSCLGLPRLVPDGPGIELCGHHFPPGTALSVPAYSIHHSTEIWGDDADEFRPERWESINEEQKSAFIPFSQGPRGCVGRNLAEMELVLITVTIARLFDFELLQDILETREGFLRKPLACNVSLRARDR